MANPSFTTPVHLGIQEQCQRTSCTHYEAGRQTSTQSMEGAAARIRTKARTGRHPLFPHLQQLSTYTYKTGVTLDTFCLGKTCDQVLLYYITNVTCSPALILTNFTHPLFIVYGYNAPLVKLSEKNGFSWKPFNPPTLLSLAITNGHKWQWYTLP